MVLRICLVLSLLASSSFVQAESSQSLARVVCYEQDFRGNHLAPGKVVVVDQVKAEGIGPDGTLQTFFGKDFFDESKSSPELMFSLKVYDITIKMPIFLKDVFKKF